MYCLNYQISSVIKFNNFSLRIQYDINICQYIIDIIELNSIMCVLYANHINYKSS